MRYPKGIRQVNRAYRKARKYVSKPSNRRKIVRGVRTAAQLVKDVAYLKSVLNPEKKEITATQSQYVVGQVNANSYGYQIFDITPIASQGVTGQTRNGNSIKVHSMVLKGQIFQQAANHHQGKLKFVVARAMGPTQTTSDFMAGMYSVNPINNMYDFNSPRATDTFKNYQVITSKIFNIKQDNYSGIQGWKDITIPLKFKNYHVKFNDNNSNTVENGQLCLIVLCDSGNCSNGTASTVSNIPVTAINTGFSVVSYWKAWFYDN